MLTRIYSREKETELATPKYKSVLASAYAGTASPRAAIKAACLICRECVMAEITNCKETGCALWAYRPYQQKQRRNREQRPMEQRAAKVREK